MTRHDINLRRNKITSGRIRRHKNFDNLMKRHKRSNRMRNIIQTIGYIIILFMLLTFIYFLGLR